MNTYTIHTGTNTRIVNHDTKTEIDCMQETAYDTVTIQADNHTVYQDRLILQANNDTVAMFNQGCWTHFTITDPEPEKPKTLAVSLCPHSHHLNQNPLLPCILPLGHPGRHEDVNRDNWLNNYGAQ